MGRGRASRWDCRGSLRQGWWRPASRVVELMFGIEGSGVDIGGGHSVAVAQALPG
jgi:hypothetical protein